MPTQVYGKSFGGSAPENYERYFVPAIGGPVAEDLIEAAELRPGERVLDVACGTGVVTRLAAKRVGPTGKVAGVDVTPGMLEVARASTPDALGIDWYETSAEAMPLPDEAYDVVLCQMGLQFIPNKLAALREMRRVLAPGGRLLFNVPGPTPDPLAIMADGLARHIKPEAESFVHLVFSLHDGDEIEKLLAEAGFRDVKIHAADKKLALPKPEEFLWQYVHSTPMTDVIDQVDDDRCSALEDDIRTRWQTFVSDGGMTMTVRMSTAIAKK